MLDMVTHAHSDRIYDELSDVAAPNYMEHLLKVLACVSVHKCSQTARHGGVCHVCVRIFFSCSVNAASLMSTQKKTFEYDIT